MAVQLQKIEQDFVSLCNELKEDRHSRCIKPLIKDIDKVYSSLDTDKRKEWLKNTFTLIDLLSLNTMYASQIAGELKDPQFITDIYINSNGNYCGASEYCESGVLECKMADSFEAYYAKVNNFFGVYFMTARIIEDPTLEGVIKNVLNLNEERIKYVESCFDGMAAILHFKALSLRKAAKKGMRSEKSSDGSTNYVTDSIAKIEEHLLTKWYTPEFQTKIKERLSKKNWILLENNWMGLKEED
ncbi:Uncharacterised protein [Candidatus Tiddalikarchaeum anstoanum]|nr:Uncharacterised protein [Candidatus Tiddalikarchaeum anstoanum]